MCQRINFETVQFCNFHQITATCTRTLHHWDHADGVGGDGTTIMVVMVAYLCACTPINYYLKADGP